MRGNSPIRDTKNELMKILYSKADLGFLAIKESYINHLVDLPLEKPLLTISRGQISTRSSGFQDYIGKTIFEEKIIEKIGKDITLKYELDIWNNDAPKFGGEDTIENIKEILFTIFEFESKRINNLSIIEFKDGDTFEDPFEEGLFHSRCVLKLRGLWIKEYEYEILEEIDINSVIVE